MKDRIELSAEETVELIACLVRAIEVGEDTANLGLQAMAEPLQ